MIESNTELKYGLIVISAPSGAGKSTLCARLLNQLSNRLALSISSTSRLPRGQEQHGKEYFFLKPEDFKNKIDQGEFAEWALVHGNYYGTSKNTLTQFWKQKKHVLLDIDVQGSASLSKLYGGRCYKVFISPPSLEVLEQRLRARGTDSEETIQKRMTNSREEMARKSEFDVEIVNDQLDEAYKMLHQLVVDKMNQWERD